MALKHPRTPSDMLPVSPSKAAPRVSEVRVESRAARNVLPRDPPPVPGLYALGSAVWIRAGRGRSKGQKAALRMTVVGYAAPKGESKKHATDPSHWRYVLLGSKGGILTRRASAVFDCLAV